jgi:hypothetical protein
VDPLLIELQHKVSNLEEVQAAARFIHRDIEPSFVRLEALNDRVELNVPAAERVLHALEVRIPEAEAAGEKCDTAKNGCLKVAERAANEGRIVEKLLVID